MSELLTIPGLDPSYLDLLDAAGFHDFEDLAEADEQELTSELERATRILRIVKTAPAREMVASWIHLAREKTGITAEEPHIVAVDYEKEAEVVAKLRSSPLAIPLPGNALREKGLSVPDIPPGLLLSEYPGELSVRMEKRIPMARSEAHASYIHVSEKHPQSRLDIDVSRLKPTSQMACAQVRVHTSLPADEDDRVALIRAPKATTNKGKDPNSRRYIRGILHSHPHGIFAGAFLTLLLMFLAPVAVLAALLLLLSREMPARFGWVDEWWLAFPLALPVVALAWAVWGMSGMCRVCGQKLFMHRPHLKNAKAHHIRGVGYVLPLCLHILLFRWFRCSHCGTPIRLKK